MKKVSPILSRFLVILGISFAIVFLSSILWVTYYGQFKVKYTPQMLLYKFGPENDSLQYKVEYQWIPLDSMSRNIIVAVLADKDKDFYIHEGFSPINADDSAASDIPQIPRHHETITQKTAQAVFLTSGDSKIKDILEPYFTILEEYLWGKDRILEIYLNTVPVGNGIFGIEAASQIYFSKNAGDLTKSEAAFIAALMDEQQGVNCEDLSEDTLSRQKDILIQMAFMTHIKLGKKPIDETEYPSKKPIYRRNWRG